MEPIKSKKNVFALFIVATILLVLFFIFWALKSVTWQYNQEIYNKDTLVLYPVIFKYLFSISSLQERILFSAVPFISIIILIYFNKISKGSRFIIYGIIFIQFCIMGFILFRIIDTNEVNNLKNKYINSKLLERRSTFIAKIEEDVIRLSDYNNKALAYSESISKLDSIAYLCDFLEDIEKSKDLIINEYRNLILLYDSINSTEKIQSISKNYYPKLSYIVKKTNGTDDIITKLPELFQETFHFSQKWSKIFDKIADQEYDGNIEYNIINWYKYFKIRRDKFFNSETEFPKLYYNICEATFYIKRAFGGDTIVFIQEYSSKILLNTDFSSYCDLLFRYQNSPSCFDFLTSRIANRRLEENEVNILLNLEKKLLESNQVNHYQRIGKILSNYTYTISSTADSLFSIIPFSLNPDEYGNEQLFLHYLILNGRWDEIIAKTKGLEEKESQLGYAVLAIASKAKGDDAKYNKYKEEAAAYDIVKPGELFLNYAKYFGDFNNDSLLFIAIKYIQFAKLFADDIEYGGHFGIGKTKIYNKDFKVKCYSESAIIYEKLKMYENAIAELKSAKSIDGLGNVINYDKKIFELQKRIRATSTNSFNN